MNSRAIQHIDNANAAAVLDIIQNILAKADNINIAGKAATEAIRDLTGVYAVLLSVSVSSEESRTLSISPAKRHKISLCSPVQNLISEAMLRTHAELVENLEHDFAIKEIDRKIESAIIAPLISNNKSIGSLVLIGLPKWDWGYGPLLRIIDLMTNLLALTLQTALLCESQEHTISQRNSELIEKNKQLVDENIKRKTAEHQLKEYNENLENIIKDRTHELSEKNRQLLSEISVRKEAETKLKNTTAQLIQTEKLVSIGQLAAGVAHEINGPLGAITSSNEIVKKHFNETLTIILNKSQCFNDYLPLINDVIDAQKKNVNISLSSRELRHIKTAISDNLECMGIENHREITEFIINTCIYDKYEDHLKTLKEQDPDSRIFIQDIASILQCTHITDIAVHQASNVVSALRNFARTEENSVKQPTDVQVTIETAITLYGNVIKHGLELNLNFEKTPLIMAHADQLCQVWTNLIQNAAQAMNYKGTLNISLCEENSLVRAEFTDDGPGIPDDILKRIFEPLFTTKKPGEGTGLGLDIVKQIVERHDGKINVSTKIGVGTTFTVLLPVK